MNRSLISNRCTPSVLELLKSQRILLVLATGLFLAGCPAKTTAVNDSGPVDDTGPTDDVGVDTSDDTGASDAGSDAAVDTGPDVQPDIQPDVPPADVPPECTSDDQCYKIKNANSICQTTTCAAGKCTDPVLKSGTNVCCADADCAEVTCQTGACNKDKGQCEYSLQANCCPDKETPLQKVKFEDGTLGGFTSSVSTAATGSTVNWQVSTKRSHTGKAAAYFGNECYNYDTSATAATSCQSTGAAAKVTGKLTTTEIVIPKDTNGQYKPTVLHYWLWLQADPSFLTTNPGNAGTSCTSCAIDQVCVNFGNGAKDACMTETDVLTVSVNGTAGPTPVWSSVAIDKSTGGKWVHRVINLAGFGPTVTVTWQFATLNGVNNQYEGVYLDDIEAETLCATDNTACDKNTPTCANASGNPCTITACTFYDNVTDKGICFGDMKSGCCAGVADCQDNNTCTIDACSNQVSGAATGTCSNVPDASQSQCCLPSNLFGDAFENGISAWKNIGSNSTAVGWKVNPIGGCDGSQSLVFTDSTFQSYADPKLTTQGPKGTICSPEVQLQSGTLYDVVSFNVNLISEWCGQLTYNNPPGSQIPCTLPSDCTIAGESCNTVLGECALSAPLDKLSVTFQTGGQYCGAVDPKTGSVECSSVVSNIALPLWSSDKINGCTDGKCQSVELHLDQFAGKKGRVCFTFDAGDPSGNNFSGPSIDNFSMDISCQNTICKVDGDCSCKPIIEAGHCDPSGAGLCSCIPTGKCVASADCDDKDSCTVDTCVQGTCDSVLTAGCCSEKAQVAYESFETSKGTTLPTGWATSFATAAASPTGDPYDTTMKWHISGDNFYGTSPDLWSLYFGNTLGNYDAGSTKVPYGLVTSEPVTVGAAGTTIVTFHLNLSTEWDAPATFAIPQFNGTVFAVDRLRFGFADAATPTNITWAWSSYDIGGTTNGVWTTISVKVPAALAGKSVLLAWEFDAGNPKNNNHIGPYIDGISMWTTCTPPVCVPDSDCVPTTPDVCKSYACSLNEPTKTFSCATAFKAGPGCCQPGAPLPAVTFESGVLTGSNLTPTATPGVLVNWQVVPHKHMDGKYELYFGNPLKWNYDDPVANCGGVSGTLDTQPLKIDVNPKQSAQLQFSLYADIEQPVGSFQTEHFQVIVKQGVQAPKVIWDATDPVYGLKSSQYKSKQNIVLPLTPYQGLNIVIEFRFDSGDCSLNDKYEGIFLDDIQVTEPCL